MSGEGSSLRKRTPTNSPRVTLKCVRRNLLLEVASAPIVPESTLIYVRAIGFY